ncbi:predicted protein [Verticillium alfalfae VaMs.102]|uniref:Predicted protein n=1 Tax=Verticillium alfalfae (strain VaMs.102 / ATCC MYA-4576 / FGSC 10136) TaxID=526221 RepID=C9SXA6_VERA1|nr:predicted protein [Verticillium alfalfae VaMs.102]EEY23296.1 predicted protein [Verticillium alfalfae VaMs.102]
MYEYGGAHGEENCAEGVHVAMGPVAGPLVAIRLEDVIALIPAVTMTTWTWNSENVSPERYIHKFPYCEHLSSWRQHLHGLGSGTVSPVHSPSEMGSAEPDPNKDSLPHEPEARSLIIGASVTAAYAVAAGVMILMWPASKALYFESQTRPLKERSGGHMKLNCISLVNHGWPTTIVTWTITAALPERIESGEANGLVV